MITPKIDRRQSVMESSQNDRPASPRLATTGIAICSGVLRWRRMATTAANRIAAVSATET
jgi:hypothetical protein